MAGSRPGMCSAGMCECVPQCNKQCGDDGCGGRCPSSCDEAHCVNDRCVECVSKSECPDPGEDCKASACNQGRCGVTNLNSGRCETSQGFEGTCSAGSCRCTASCSPGQCAGMDACGKACTYSCSNGQKCNPSTQRCEASGAGLYANCESAPCADGLICTQVISSARFCYRDSSKGCQGAEAPYFNVCVVPCSRTRTSCPAATACAITSEDTGDGWCVPGIF